MIPPPTCITNQQGGLTTTAVAELTRNISKPTQRRLGRGPRHLKGHMNTSQKPLHPRTHQAGDPTPPLSAEQGVHLLSRRQRPHPPHSSRARHLGKVAPLFSEGLNLVDSGGLAALEHRWQALWSDQLRVHARSGRRRVEAATPAVPAAAGAVATEL